MHQQLGNSRKLLQTDNIINLIMTDIKCMDGVDKLDIDDIFEVVAAEIDIVDGWDIGEAVHQFL